MPEWNRKTWPAAVAAGMTVLLLSGALLLGTMSHKSTRTQSDLVETADRVTLVVTVFDVEPGDVLVVPPAWRLNGPEGPDRILVAPGGEGIAAAEGKSPHAWLDTPLTMRQLEVTRPPLPEGATSDPTPNGDLRDAVDLVFTAAHDANETAWNIRVAAYRESTGASGPFAVFPTHLTVVDGTRAMLSTLVGAAAMAAGFVTLALLLLRGRGPTTPALAGMSGLVGIAAQANVLVGQMVATLWVVGALLVVGGFGLMEFVNAWTHWIGYSSWTTRLALPLVQAAWLMAIVLWWLQLRRARRLARAWRGLPPPEV